MEIANGIIWLSDAHEHHVYNITPMEALVLRAMHGKGALYGVEVTGEAAEVDQFGKPVQVSETTNEKGLHAHKIGGKTVMVEGVEEITTWENSEKPRTDKDELARLRAKYTGHVYIGGQPLNAVDAALGGLDKLPTTFKQIKSAFGEDFEVVKPEAAEAPKAE